MNERSEMIECIRGEIVGPARILKEPSIVDFVDSDFRHDSQWPNGPIVWKPGPEDDLQEVLYFDRESPFRKYGTGLLYPEGFNYLLIFSTFTAFSHDLVIQFI